MSDDEDLTEDEFDALWAKGELCELVPPSRTWSTAHTIIGRWTPERGFEVLP